MEQEHPLAFGGPVDAVTHPIGTIPRLTPITGEGPAEPGGMRKQTAAVRQILKALEPLPPEGRMRVIRAAAALFGVSLP